MIVNACTQSVRVQKLRVIAYSGFGIMNSDQGAPVEGVCLGCSEYLALDAWHGAVCGSSSVNRWLRELRV